MSKIKTRKHSNNSQKRARLSGWLTSDADEIERRRWRGLNEAIRIEPQTPKEVFFGDFQARSDSGQVYSVEIRSLAEPINSCDCPDHRHYSPHEGAMTLQGHVCVPGVAIRDMIIWPRLGGVM